MSAKYKIILYFENQTKIIVSIKLLGLDSDADSYLITQWLYFDKVSNSLNKLWLNSSDSSDVVEERYFEQGYMKFDNKEGTFIEKFNSSQHKFYRGSKIVVNPVILELIEDYLK